MAYLLIILFAVWNGLVIRWKLKNDQLASKKWHKVGWFARVLVLLIALFPFMPEWYWYVINPAALLVGWHGALLTILLITGMSYWLYNYIINRINGWKWDYNGFEDNKHYRVLLYVYSVITLAWGVGGGYFIKWIEQY